MDVLAESLDSKLCTWKPEVAEQVRQRVTEIIELADQDALDVMRSRTVEQEVVVGRNKRSLRSVSGAFGL